MLDADTKRRIDACRDILVGKVPDPKSQVEQITIALIYKFMDDMDAEAEELGGKRTFFAGDYARYGWAKLMAPGLGGFEVLALYSEAIATMRENPGVPELFRDIFKNAYLPYRDPETLKSFLKEINFFSYDHSERLGDAFEYLLSVLGSQGDAGQFRTPRDIIDFIVEIIAPEKNESVLDPACGTAGFLISAWKYVLRNNTRNILGDKLSSDERTRLATNMHGYDISPDMVRLSLANLYLHGFPAPNVDEYDTLTQEDKWNDVFDVILANPPFMSPKGGIRPHKKFSVPSNRSEVLFVDYIIEHLSATGRAGIVVPEGIIFQGGSAYKRLRKLLVNESLVGVISLPSGVFQPYSGVKTSILVLDKREAKRNSKVLFSKVDAIGVSLGIKRTISNQNDLPKVLGDFRAYYAGDSVSNCSILVERDVIAVGDFNLTGSRYQTQAALTGAITVTLGEICTIQKGRSSSTKTPQGEYPLFVTAKDQLTSDEFHFDGDAVCVPLISSTGHGRASINRVHFARGKFAAANLLAVLQCKDDQVIHAKFLHLLLDTLKDKLAGLMKGAANVSMKVDDLALFQIPLPAIEVQHQIVAEIEGYQKIIDGARQVLDNYKPHIVVSSDWPEMPLGELCRFIDYRGKTPEKTTSGIPLITAKNVREGFINPEPREFIADEDYDAWMTRGIPQPGDVLFTMEAPLGNVAEISQTGRFALAQRLVALCPNREILIGAFLKDLLLSEPMQKKILAHQSGTTVYGIKASVLKEITIPVPDIATQRAIVAEIKAEQALVAANRELIRRMEAKVKAAIDRVWGN